MRLPTLFNIWTVSASQTHAAHLRRHDESAAEIRPIELFFDLVYVLAVTQLTRRLLAGLTLRGAAVPRGTDAVQTCGVGPIPLVRLAPFVAFTALILVAAVSSVLVLLALATAVVVVTGWWSSLTYPAAVRAEARQPASQSRNPRRPRAAGRP